LKLITQAGGASPSGDSSVSAALGAGVFIGAEGGRRAPLRRRSRTSRE
jgi:hypothetical protein